jgi:hypothetical protein
MHHLYHIVGQAYGNMDDRFLAQSKVGIITRESKRGDLVWLQSRQPVELTRINVHSSWTPLYIRGKDGVLKDVMDGKTALVFLDDKSDNFLYYKGETKPGQKPQFYVSQDNSHWEPESNPVNAIVYGVWYLIN